MMDSNLDRVFSKLKLTVLSIFALISFTTAQNLVDKAWQAWNLNDQVLTEQLFKEALAKDSTNYRAHLGLSYLYQMQYKFEDSWDEYKTALKYVENPTPYILAFMQTTPWIENQSLPNSGTVKYLEKIVNNKTGNGLLQALACENLGTYYASHNRLDDAKKLFDRLGTIDQWTVIGPFDNISASGFDKDFQPEKKYDPGATYKGKNDTPANWFTIKNLRLDRWEDFNYYFADRNSIFFGNTFVYSPDKQTVQLRVGTSGSLKTYLNDDLVLKVEDENNNDLDTYTAETTLQKGWNRILVKVGCSEITRANFLVRITDKSGFPINNLKVSTEKHKYPLNPGPAIKTIALSYETYFENKIKSNPDRLENYLILASAYLKNDKATEAEILLRKAQEIAPDNAVFYMLLIEAFVRGEKNDDVQSAIEKINQLDPNVPFVIERKFQDFLNTKDYDSAEEYISKLEKLVPQEERVLKMKLSLYVAKSQNEKVIELAQEGYKKYPEDWDFVYFKTVVSAMTNRNYDEAIQILENYSQKYTDDAVFTNLANYYLRASQPDKWQATMERLLRYKPCSPGYYYQLAKTFYTMQRYNDAKKYIMETLDICPGSDLYLSLLGDIYLAQKDTTGSREAYSKALDYNPTNYSTRDKLNELEGTKSAFSKLKSYDYQELIKEAPGAASYPGEDAVVLLDDYKRVVYERGASEYSEEMLVQVLTNNGISDFTEYWINYNPNIEELIVEKAMVVKKDGTQINADNDSGHLVFKSLEVNDFVYIKWRVRNYYSGKLSNQFWDDFYLNSYYPVKHTRYSMLIPKDLKVYYKTRNTDLKPETSTVDGKTLYVWELTDEPAIHYEYAMPTLSDIGKSINVSSIENWNYLVDWYLDIAASKTKSTFEIRYQLDQILTGDKNLTTLQKVKKIYDYLTENITYSSVPFRQSAFTPQSARSVLVNKIGDCKDMATLCISMLKEIGVPAYYVLVNTWDMGANKETLPSIEFNHAIVAAEIDGKMHFMDLTANNFPFGTVPSGDINAFALLVKKGNNKPFYIDKSNFETNYIHRDDVVNFGDDNSVNIQSENKRFGASTAELRHYYRFKNPTERMKILGQILTSDYSNVKINDLQLPDLDTNTDKVDYSYDYTINAFVSEAGGFKFLKIPWSDPDMPNQAFSQETRLYPLNYKPDLDSLSETMIIKIPEGYIPVEVPADVAYSCTAADYSLTFLYAGGMLHATRKIKYKQDVVEPKDYPAFREFYNNTVKSDGLQILLKKK